MIRTLRIHMKLMFEVVALGGFAALAGIVRAQEDAAAVQPPPQADATAMVVFLFIFIGMIVAYIAWIWHQQRKKKKDGMA
jgi:hypothetical protein